MGHREVRACTCTYVSQPAGAAPMDPENPEQELLHIKAALLTLVQQHWSVVEKGKMPQGAATMTTDRLFSIINRHAPEQYTPALLSIVLEDANYQTVRIGTELRWLVLPR